MASWRVSIVRDIKSASVLAFSAIFIAYLFVAFTVDVPIRHGCDDNVFLEVGARYPDYKPASNWGPIYGLYHAGLQLFFSEEAAYYMNYRILAFLLPVSATIFIFLVSANLALAGVLGLAMALNWCNLIECPRINAFALICLTVGLILIRLVPNPLSKAAYLTVLSFLLSLIRPEYFIVFLVSLIMLMALIWKKGIRGNRSARIAVLLSALACALLFAEFGNPIHHPGYNRNIVAFGQGYAVNVSLSNPERTGNPYSDWRDVLAEDFGECSGYFSCYLANPKQARWHYQMNIERTASLLKFVIFSSGRLKEVDPFAVKAIATSSLLIGVTLLVIRWIRRGRSRFLDIWRVNWVEIVFLSGCALAALAGSVLGTPYPRHAFGVVLALLYMVVIVTCGRASLDDNKPNHAVVRARDK